jgi:hypothetical protein
VVWGVDWGKAGDTPCVSIIKRKADGGIEVMAVEYAPYTHPQPAQPKREPLTDDWIRSKCNQTWVFDTVKQWVREVEAAHGIKGKA